MRYVITGCFLRLSDISVFPGNYFNDAFEVRTASFFTTSILPKHMSAEELSNASCISRPFHTISFSSYDCSFQK